MKEIIVLVICFALVYLVFAIDFDAIYTKWLVKRALKDHAILKKSLQDLERNNWDQDEITEVFQKVINGKIHL